MIADMFTKPLTRAKFRTNRWRLGLLEFTDLAKWGSVRTDFANCELIHGGERDGEKVAGSEQTRVSLRSPSHAESNEINFTSIGEELTEISGLERFATIPHNQSGMVTQNSYSDWC
jgi:hypothetical protein